LSLSGDNQNIGSREEELTAAEGNGPVNALDHALRKALTTFYPQIKEMRLVDFKVRTLEGSEGTAAASGCFWIQRMVKNLEHDRCFRKYY